jgi:hypothetical protein
MQKIHHVQAGKTNGKNTHFHISNDFEELKQ